MIPIKHICSLGKNCHGASLLKRNNWKKESYPFDWIFTNDKMIKHCIGNDFKIFLDKEYYPDKDENAWQQSHSFYHPFSDDKTFNHHNPLCDKDYGYFERCVERFRTLLKTNNFKVFIHMISNNDPINDNIRQKALELNNFLKEKTDNFALIYIIHTISTRQSYIFETNDNIHFIQVFTKSASNGKEFLLKEDNEFLDKLLNEVYIFNIVPLK